MAYAAAVSLKQTIKRLQNPNSQSRFLLLPPNSSEIEFICKDLSYSQSFLEKSSSSESSERVDACERQIKDAVQKIEDLIEFHISESELSEDESLNLAFSQQLVKVKQELNTCLWCLWNAENEYQNSEDQQPINYFATDAISSGIESGGKHKMVGLDDQRHRLKELVVDESFYFRMIFSIIGMAGIGKTTLAREVYYDSSVIENFDLRLFMPIGPKYQLREFLLLALHQLDVQIYEIHKMMNDELGEVLYNSLHGRRYLIVLDDIWSIEVLNELQKFFPDDRNSSRIILTTSVDEVTRGVGFYHQCIRMRFLNDNESWNLLHDVVFNTDQELCSLQLEIIGKKIAKNCEGLPLAIIEVGQLLSMTEKTVEHWKKVAENEDPLIITTDDDTPLSKTLSLSYRMLPHYLKACFLYMGAFPKKYEITFSKLFNLWVAEGIIESNLSTESLEEVADKYLDALQCRNLVLFTESSCRLHFVFRSLCVSQAQKEKFFHIINKYADSFPDQDTDSQQWRRLCIHNNIVLGFEEVHSWMESVPAVRSLLCFGPQQQYPIRLYLHFRLLRVLDALRIRFYEFPHQVLDLVQLRYLAITYDGEIPGSISRLWNLEVLIVHRHRIIKFSNAPVYLPLEVWKLRELRHLECMGLDLPDPSSTKDDDDDCLVLEKLLRLSGVSAHSFTLAVLSRMPNLQKIGMRIESAQGAVETLNLFEVDFSHLKYLAILKCIVVNPVIRPPQVVSSIQSALFPVNNLTKISLSGCGFSWEYMSAIAVLPELVSLKLRCNAFQGPKWKTFEGGFLRLYWLLLEDLDIEEWTTNSDHFPLLTRLIIRHCYKLQQIPCGIGNIPTLRIIEVDDCSPSVAISARLQGYRKNEMPPVKVGVHSSWDDHKKLKS